MGERLIDPDSQALSRVPNVDRDLLLDDLPRFVRSSADPVTVKDCVRGITDVYDRDPPSSESQAYVEVVASDAIRKGLDWLVEEGYLDRTDPDQGALEYSFVTVSP